MYLDLWILALGAIAVIVVTALVTNLIGKTKRPQEKEIEELHIRIQELVQENGELLKEDKDFEKSQDRIKELQQKLDEQLKISSETSVQLKQLQGVMEPDSLYVKKLLVEGMTILTCQEGESVTAVTPNVHIRSTGKKDEYEIHPTIHVLEGNEGEKFPCSEGVIIIRKGEDVRRVVLVHFRMKVCGKSVR